MGAEAEVPPSIMNCPPNATLMGHLYRWNSQLRANGFETFKPLIEKLTYPLADTSGMALPDLLKTSGP